MRFEAEECHDLERSLAREWLLTNGLGGYASGTLAGAATRRTHGLLIAAPPPQGPRWATLFGLQERLQRPDGEALELGCNLFAHGLVRPRGHLLLEQAVLSPWPTYRYRVWEGVLEKKIFLIGGHDAVVVRYRQDKGPPIRISLSLLLTLREEEGLERHHEIEGGVTQAVPGRLRCQLDPGRPILTLWHDAGSFLPVRAWYQGLLYRDEGVEEDAFVPGTLQGDLGAGGSLHLVASIEENLFRALAGEGRLGTPPASTLAACVKALEEEEEARARHVKKLGLERANASLRRASAARREATEGDPAGSIDEDEEGFTAQLMLAADRFVVEREGRRTLSAGFPRLGERTRDVLAALPGLVLVPRRFPLAREILTAYASHLDEGLLPERLNQAGSGPAPADAPLWLVRAADLYLRHSEDVEFLRASLFPALEAALQHYRAGTRHGVRVDRDGLLLCEEEAAAPRAWGVPPGGAAPAARTGKTVELNALWFHALAALSFIARRLGKPENAAFYTAWAREHQRAFNEAFWCEEQGFYYDSLDEKRGQVTLRAYQVLAASLSPALVPPDRGARMVEALEKQLLRRHGLAVEAAPPAGDPIPRRDHTEDSDDASHAWLLAQFLFAYLRSHQRTPAALQRARQWLAPLRQLVAASGSISEARCERSPFASRGALAHALGTAEVLRIWVEELAPVRREVTAPSV